jgi:hypothetical protein
MRQYQGLQAFSQQQTKRFTAPALAAWLAEDLQSCHCLIAGKNQQDERIILAQLPLQADSWLYHRIEQRIDFIVEGHIIRNDYLPLIYHLQGQKFSVSGRCSMIGKVCGVDLYLSASYTGEVGDFVQQRFSLPLKQLLKMAVA